MSDDLVLYEVDGNVGYVTLNRPDKLNAISDGLRLRAVEVLHQADADEATRVVVLRGAGRAPVYAARTESGAQFEALTKKENLRAALKWRHQQFEE